MGPFFEHAFFLDEVRRIAAHREYEKIRRIVVKVAFFKQSETVLAPKNYWKKIYR